MSRIAIVVLAAAASLSACAPPDEPVVAPSTVVRQPIDRDRVLQLHEELRIDGSRDDAPFFNVSAAALDAERNMYVLDRGNMEILVFDSVGNRIGEIGRAGQGPGEFTSPNAMSLRGDTLAISDGGNRFHAFSLAGDHLVTRVYNGVTDDGDAMRLSGIVGTPDGWLTIASAYFRYDSDGNAAQSNPVSRSRLMRIEWEGRVREVGFRLRHEPVGQMVGIYFVQPPFSYTPRFAVDGLGRIHRFPGPEYVAEVLDGTGELLHTVENDYPATEISREDLNEWRESRACGPESMECDDSRTDLALRMEIPRIKGVVSRLVAFETGHLAVMRAGTDPDPDDRLTMGEYDIFAPDGRFLGRLPLGLSPRWFDGTTLVATTWDEMMVPSMHRYRVEVP